MARNKQRILIVDDDADFVEAARLTVEPAGLDRRREKELNR